MTAGIIPARTLEEQARALGQRIRQHEESGHHLAREAHTLYLDYEARRLTDNAIPGFKGWFAALTGVPEGSVWYYVQVGTALAAHLVEPEPTPPAVQGQPTSALPAAPAALPSARDLRAAGSALMAGAPAGEVKQALHSGRVQDYASAQQSGGTVSIRLALPAKVVWDEETGRWGRITKLPMLEAQALMVTSLQYVSESDILAIARAGELTGQEAADHAEQ